MSNTRTLIHIQSGRHLVPQNDRAVRLFDKLSTTPQYMWSDEQVDVTVPEAARILEKERQALVSEREAFEKEKEEFYHNIEQPNKRGRKPKTQ